MVYVLWIRHAGTCRSIVQFQTNAELFDNLVFKCYCIWYMDF